MCLWEEEQINACPSNRILSELFIKAKLVQTLSILTVVPAALAQWPPALSSPAGSGPSAPPPLLSDTCSPSPHSSAVTPAGAPAPLSNPAQHITMREHLCPK